MNSPKFISLVTVAFLSVSFVSAAESDDSLAEKGRLILSDDFTKPPVDRKAHDFAEGWQRRLSFGKWTSLEKGGINALNVLEEGHGPVLTYLGPVKDVIIECEFRLPTKAGPERHFRIFLDHPDYRGHTIAAWANLATTFQPLGLTLLHNPKTKDKKVLKEVRFGPKDVNLIPGEWHKMRLELVGKRVCVTVDDVIVEGEHPALQTTKSKIGLNPGKAGGDLRSFKVWEAKRKQ